MISRFESLPSVPLLEPDRNYVIARSSVSEIVVCLCYIHSFTQLSFTVHYVEVSALTHSNYTSLSIDVDPDFDSFPNNHHNPKTVDVVECCQLL